MNSLAKHSYWKPGEPDCPREIKAGNGELHTLRCKLCGVDNPRSPYCVSPEGIIEALSARLEQAERALQNIKALAMKRQAEGGPNGNLAAVEGFARAGLGEQ